MIGAETRVVFVTNPHSPSGTWMSERDVRSIVESAGGALVVLDEAYVHYSDTPGYLHLADDYDNLVVLRTFSKAFGLAGLRVGFGVGPKPVIDACLAVKPTWNMGVLQCAGAAAALDDKDHIEATVAAISEGRARAQARFGELDRFRMVPGSRSNFFLVEILDGGTDSTAVFEGLLERGVIVKDGSVSFRGLRDRFLRCDAKPARADGPPRGRTGGPAMNTAQRASGLHGRYYSDPAVFEAEMEQIFARSWVMVGHVSQVDEPGTVITADVGDESVLVANDAGTLRAMYNVCQHRGHQLVAAERVQVAQITCPYHAWTYGLDGRLLHARGESVGEVCVPAVRLETQGGFVFVNLDGDAASLSQTAPGVEQELLGLVPTRPSGCWPPATRTTWGPTGRSSSRTTTSATTARTFTNGSPLA